MFFKKSRKATDESRKPWVRRKAPGIDAVKRTSRIIRNARKGRQKFSAQAQSRD